MNPTRRFLLRSGALTFLSVGVGPRFLGRLALASPDSTPRPRVLVAIFLRGAMDGLMAVPPINALELRRLRPNLAMSAARGAESPLVDLDGRFGLHPAFAPLLPFWIDGRLAIVHAVGSPHPTRSHFDAQDYMETGTPGRKGTTSGWLNRLAARVGGARTALDAVALSSRVPRALQGDHPALAIEDLARFVRPTSESRVGEDLGLDLDSLFLDEASGLLRQRSREMLDATRVLSQTDIERTRRERGGRYPGTPLGDALLQIGHLVRAGVGLRVACAESNGWDTHADQGTVDGPFHSGASDLASSIAAFWEDLGPYQDDVLVMTMTEFGRTVAENGSEGTDHGHGSCLFLLGNRVRGGTVHGQFPESLVPELLFEGRDLPVVTDFRSVFAEVAGSHFDLAAADSIFPGWRGPRMPLLW